MSDISGILSEEQSLTATLSVESPLIASLGTVVVDGQLIELWQIEDGYQLTVRKGASVQSVTWRDGEPGRTPVITASKESGVTTIYVDGVAIAHIADGGTVTPEQIVEAIGYTPASAEAFNELTDALSEVFESIENTMEQKLDKPEDAPVVGKVLKVKAVNEDGTFVCEWAEAGSGGGVADVQVNGTSVVADGVGNVKIGNGLTFSSSTKTMSVYSAGPSLIASRSTTSFVPASSTDALVKAAMCDGKGAAWTAEEQAAAQQRLGILSVEEVLF